MDVSKTKNPSPDQKAGANNPEGPVEARIAGRYIPAKPPTTRDGRKKATP